MEKLLERSGHFQKNINKNEQSISDGKQWKRWKDYKTRGPWVVDQQPLNTALLEVCKKMEVVFIIVINT